MKSLDDTFVSRLAKFYSNLQFNSVPKKVVKRARMALVDFLSVLIAGYKEGELAPLINRYVLHLQGIEESTILCLNKKVPSSYAALSLGVMAHSVELDDGHRFGTAHPGSVVIPAALSVAEKNKNNFSDILLSIVVGYDIMLRIARAINPSHLIRGFHSTGTCGTIGAATACAKLVEFGSEQTAYAMAVAGLQSAGLQEMLHDYPAIKSLQVGKAAAAGVLSMELVRLGAKGPRSLFEGTHGWLKAMADSFDENYMIEKLGERWEIMNTYTKLYPACRHCHCPIDLAIEVYQKHQFSLNEIESIVVNTYSVAISEVGQNYHPKTFDEAMFSLCFSVALALKNGRVTLSEYREENFNDPILHEIVDKIVIQKDKAMDNLYPKERGARLTIKLKGGRVLKGFARLPKGEPETALDEDGLSKKVFSILNPYMSGRNIQNLWDLIMVKDIEDLSMQDIIDYFGESFL